MEAAWNPGPVTTHRIGGGSIIEIHTDQGLSGIGPAIDGSLESAKAQLIGTDPFSIEQLAGPLRYYVGQSPRSVSSLEIALWTSSARRPASRSTNSGAPPKTGCLRMPA
jgi:L-alanine-DL-glutamate epimerase-like enolase superfamily enzyme